MSEKQVDRGGIAERFLQVWSQAIIAVTGAEEEATKLLTRVQESLGWTQEEALKSVREFSERLASQRRDAERRLEEAVKHSLSLLSVPRREEVAQLTARVEDLARRVENLPR